MISVKFAARSIPGKVRQINEDSYLANSPIFLVADGMGGHSAGEVASQLVVDRFKLLLNEPFLTKELVVATIKQVNYDILLAANESSEKSGMGTTLVGLVLVVEANLEYWMIFNIGDSRLYHLSDNKCDLITQDHSRVQELIDMGLLSPLEAITSPEKHIITRAVGVDEALNADIWLMLPTPGEKFLLCSDGLTNEVSDDEIYSALLNFNSVEEIADHLVDTANSRKGRDNITSIVVEVENNFETTNFDTIPKPTILNL